MGWGPPLDDPELDEPDDDEPDDDELAASSVQESSPTTSSTASGAESASRVGVVRPSIIVWPSGEASVRRSAEVNASLQLVARSASTVV
jgi:hypothetical protein